MFLFSPILAFLFTLSSGVSATPHWRPSKDKCSIFLRAGVQKLQYQDAVRQTGVTRLSYLMARSKLRQRLHKLKLTNPGDLFRAVAARVLKYDEKSRFLVARILSVQKSTSLTEEELNNEINALAREPAMIAFVSMVDFTNGDEPRVERLLEQFAASIPGLRIGPRQAHIVRTVMRNVQLREGDKVLEIGFGTPAALLALTHLTSATGLGIDRAAPWSDRNGELERHGVRVVEGDFPEQSPLVESRGPFAAIYAQDVFIDELDERMMKSVYNMLKPAGVFIVVNDYAQMPEYSKEQMAKLGFETVQSEGITQIPDVWKSLMDYSDDAINAGQLRLLVLRRGRASTPRAPSLVDIISLENPPE